MTTIKFDLIKSLIKHLDPHLSIVLLEHYEAQEHKVFHPEVLQREKLLVLIRTKIIDYIQSECDKINDPVTQKIKSGNIFLLLKKKNCLFSLWRKKMFLVFWRIFVNVLVSSVILLSLILFYFSFSCCFKFLCRFLEIWSLFLSFLPFYLFFINVYFAEFEKIKEKTEIDAGNYLNSAEGFINFFKEREPELEKEKFSKAAYSRNKEFENVIIFFFFRF